MLSRDWEDAGKVFEVPNGIVEDFVVFPRGEYEAYYCMGSDFTRLSVFKSVSFSVKGPFTNEEKVTEGGHVRICKGRVGNNTALITDVRPGVPMAGIYLLTHLKGDCMYKKLLIEPKPGSLYSVVAGNPSVIFDGENYNIFFEGRTADMKWRIFQAVWDGSDSIKVQDEPLFDGANPYITKFGDRYYLYYSSYRKEGGFDVSLKWQKAK